MQFYGSVQRGPCFWLSKVEGEDLVDVVMLSSDLTGEPRVNEEQDCVDLGRSGSGRDELVLPGQLTPGDYVVCIETREACARLSVIAP
jgi:hypothetical protein